MIPEYMIRQNRPYSAIDVYNNLHQEFGKTVSIFRCMYIYVCSFSLSAGHQMLGWWRTVRSTQGKGDRKAEDLLPQSGFTK